MAIKIPSSNQYETSQNKIVLNNRINSVSYVQDVFHEEFMEVFSSDDVRGKASQPTIKRVFSKDLTQYLEIEYVLTSKSKLIEDIDTTVIDFGNLSQGDSNVALTGIWGTSEINTVGELGICDIEKNVEFNIDGTMPNYLKDYTKNGFTNVYYSWSKRGNDSIVLNWSIVTALRYTHWRNLYGNLSSYETLFDGNLSASDDTLTLSFSLLAAEKDEQEVETSDENIAVKNKYKITSNELFQSCGYTIGEPTITQGLFNVPVGVISSEYEISDALGVVNSGIVTNFALGEMTEAVRDIIYTTRCYVIIGNVLYEYGGLGFNGQAFDQQGELVSYTLSVREIIANPTIGDNLANRILDAYRTGRQYVSLNCFYDEYENTYGENEIAKNSGELFEPEKVILPMVIKGGVEQPLLYTYKNGVRSPKIYEVELRTLTYDGTLVQSLNCLECKEEKYEIVFNSGFGEFATGKYSVTFTAGNGNFNETTTTQQVAFNAGNGEFTTL